LLFYSEASKHILVGRELKGNL